MLESASVPSWALNRLFYKCTHNNVSGISHSHEKNGVHIRMSGNSCGAFLGGNESFSAYPLMTLPVRRAVIRLSFASIADTLREEFANKGIRLYENIARSLYCHFTNSGPDYSWGTNRLDFSERLCQPISREEVAWALDKVKKDVAPGKVGVTVFIMSADVLFDVWCAFFEVCCGYGMVPSVWRESLVVPVPKK